VFGPLSESLLVLGDDYVNAVSASRSQPPARKLQCNEIINRSLSSTPVGLTNYTWNIKLEKCCFDRF